MGERPSSVSPKQIYIHIMYFRQLAWLVALCTLMCAVHVTSAAKLDLASKAESDMEWYQPPGYWKKKGLEIDGLKIKLVYTHKHNEKYTFRKVYVQHNCKVLKTYKKSGAEYTDNFCEMCQFHRASYWEHARDHWICQKEDLYYTKRCVGTECSIDSSKLVRCSNCD